MKKSGSDGGPEWYQKPVGIVLLTVAGGILIWLVTSTLQQLFAPAKPVVQVIETPAKAQVEPQRQPQPQQPKSQKAGERNEREKPKPPVEEDPK